MNFAQHKPSKPSVTTKEIFYDSNKRRIGRLLALIVLIAPFSAIPQEIEGKGEAAEATSSFFMQILWSEPGSTYISILAACLFGWLAIIASKNRDRKKNTFELISESSRDDKLRDAHEVLRSIHDSESDDVKKFAHSSKSTNEETIAIRYLLNHYEYLAVGLKFGVFDEDALFSAKRTIIVKAYSMCEEYIVSLRKQTGADTAYIEIEQLHSRWKDKALTLASAKKWQHRWSFWK